MAEVLQTEKASGLQCGAQISHHENVVKIEPTTEGDQRDEAAMKT